MALNKRQKRRLKDSSAMVKNARSMAEEFEEINLEYKSELNILVEKIRYDIRKSDIEESSKVLSGKKRKRSFRSKRSRLIQKRTSQKVAIYESNIAEEQPNGSSENESLPKDIDIPDWAKDVWRKIMLCCHPDRIDNSRLPADKIELRRMVLLDAMECKEKNDWIELLFLGILIDQYTEKLNQKKQLTHMNNLYSAVVEKINGIQNSTTWLWGTNWDDPDVRFRILSAILHANHIKPPDKNYLIKIINELESE